jgi:23S rRNA (cytidine1920-2'-O)/16S rRNA (cytidine1409-2'-O)-methyltransferase
VSFISVTRVLPGAVACAKDGADLLILVKPQFELERSDVAKGGIVRDSLLHEKAVAKVRKAAEGLDLAFVGVIPSRLTGTEGNQEYFLRARKRPAVESL